MSRVKICSIDGCGKVTRKPGGSLCGSHERARRIEAMPRCAHPDCEKPAERPPWCQMHMARLKKWGDVDYVAHPKVSPYTTCTIAGCESPHWTAGLCSIHYSRNRQKGDPLAEMIRVGGRICRVTGCKEKHDSRGYCLRHAYRLRKYGDPTAAGHPNRSMAEDAIFDFVKTITPHAVQSNRSIIKPYELDIYIPREA